MDTGLNDQASPENAHLFAFYKWIKNLNSTKVSACVIESSFLLNLSELAHRDGVSHWLGGNVESTLYIYDIF